jgi:Spy/CpxP family protein refolding chaperone
MKTELREGADLEVVMKKVLLVNVVCLLAASAVVASEFDLPPGKWWENQRFVDHIGLTNEQQGQIREIVFAYARRMIDLKAEVDKAGLDLANTVDQVDFDPAPVRAAYTVFQKARQRLENERFEMLLEVRQVLTYDQWRQIEEIKQRMQQNRPQQRRPGVRGEGAQRPPEDRPPNF